MVKIISTISPKTGRLKGIDVGRINCAFGPKEEIAQLAGKIKGPWGYQLLLDLPINRKKIRTNELSAEELIALAIRIKPQYVALSYVKSHRDIESFRKHFEKTGIQIVSKIEAAEAMEDLDRIILFSDAVMIDRGDLAVSIGIEKLHQAQKRIVRKCNELGRQVIVATEFLLSMVDNNQPTKSEVVDIANAISDGADFIMLSEETAIGNFSQHSVDVIKKIIAELEDKYKVILLSAGASIGMGALTAQRHTCLVDIGNTTILETQLAACRYCNINDEDIVIATGKGDSAIRDFVHHKLKKTDIEFVYNPWYENSNMLVTIWLAREFIRKGFIVIYGDVIFDPEILKRIIKNQDDIVLGVEKKRCDEEDEKICIKDGIMTLSKEYASLPFPRHKCIPVNEAYGEFIGIAKFNRWGANILINEMDKIVRESDLKIYLMEAFEHLAAKGYRLNIEDITGLPWNDNDTIYDLNLTRDKVLPDMRKRHNRIF
ncbi:MAG: pyruvate kinase [Candidatus Omnitrophota bacterium]